MEVGVGLAAARFHVGARSTARSVRLWVAWTPECWYSLNGSLGVFAGRLDIWMFSQSDARLEVQKSLPRCSALPRCCCSIRWALGCSRRYLVVQTIECLVAPLSLRYWCSCPARYSWSLLGLFDPRFTTFPCLLMCVPSMVPIARLFTWLDPWPIATLDVRSP